MAMPPRIKKIIALLKKTYPDARVSLIHRTPFELLAATILSAQCTDEQVNRVTPALFRRFPTPAAMAHASQADMEALVRSTGFYKNKARSLRGMARALVDRFGGAVPQTLEELITLPGVARKTANVVLSSAFGLAQGIVVDTHVKRLSQRLGLTQQKTPEKIERDLMNLLPHSQWIDFGLLLIQHGRKLCLARHPQCPRCPLRPFCPSASTFYPLSQ